MKIRCCHARFAAQSQTQTTMGYSRQTTKENGGLWFVASRGRKFGQGSSLWPIGGRMPSTHGTNGSDTLMTNAVNALATYEIDGLIVCYAREYLGTAAKHVNSREGVLLILQLIKTIEHQSMALLGLEMEAAQQKLEYRQGLNGFADMKQNIHLMQDMFCGRVHDSSDLFQFAIWWRETGDEDRTWNKMGREFYLKAGADHTAKELRKTYPTREYVVMPIGIEPENSP